MSAYAVGELRHGETTLLADTLLTIVNTSLRACDNLVKLTQRFAAAGHAERMGKYRQTVRLTRLLLSQMRDMVCDGQPALAPKYPELLPNIQTLLASLQRFENALTKALLFGDGAASPAKHAMANFLPVLRAMSVLDRSHLAIHADLQAVMKAAGRTSAERSRDARREWRMGAVHGKGDVSLSHSQPLSTAPVESLEKAASKLPSIRASLQLHLQGMLIGADGQTFWEKSFGFETLSISWPLFLGALSSWLKTPVTASAESLLRGLVDPVDEGCVSIFKFSDFLSSFGPLAASLRNMQALFDAPYFHGFLSMSSARFLLQHCAVGTFLVRFAEFNISQFAVDYVCAAGRLRHFEVVGSSYTSFHLSDPAADADTDTDHGHRTAYSVDDVDSPLLGAPPPAASRQQPVQSGSSLVELVQRHAAVLTSPLRVKLPLHSEWFFTTDCADTLERELLDKRRGTYAVCFSATPGQLTLLYSGHKDSVVRLPVTVTADCFAIGADTFQTLPELIASVESLCRGFSMERKPSVSRMESCSRLLNTVDNFALQLSAPAAPPAELAERVEPLVHWIMEGEKRTVIARLADIFTRSPKTPLNPEEQDFIASQAHALLDHIDRSVADRCK